MSQAPPKDITKNSIIIIPNWHPPTHPNDPLPQGTDDNPEKAVAYYISEINSLFELNEQLGTRLRKALEEKKELADAIASFEMIDRSENEDKKKRVRRCANEIERKYVCPVEECQKSYGTDSSMAQHLRLKHP